MIVPIVRAALISVLFGLGSASGQPAPWERFTVFSNGEAVGTLSADVTGDGVHVDYAVSNNGRGPQLRHDIRLGPSGFPRSWRIEGRSLFGAAVSEEFSQSDGRAQWRSQADEGQVRARRDQLYVANEDTPWSLGLYARARVSATSTAARGWCPPRPERH